MSTTGDPRNGSAVDTQVQDPFRYGWREVRRVLPDGREEWEQVPLTEEDVLHPQEEDFIVQSPAHDRDCHYLKDVLLARLADHPRVAVLHDVRIDWEVEGIKPHGPDLVVFEGVSEEWDLEDGTFYVKKLGARPLLVIEVTSPNTYKNDLEIKVEHYDKAGVPFYLIVDARLTPQGRQVGVLAYRSSPQGYVRVPADERGRLWVEPARIWVAGEGGRAVCYDEQDRRIREHAEVVRAAQGAEDRAASEARGARTARLQLLEAEQARALAEAEAEVQKARADAERAVAEAEARARQRVEGQLQQIQAELRRLLGQE
jgi:colicin import membrane protein